MKETMSEKKRDYRVVCISCAGNIREKASKDAYGLCLKCFYAMLATRLRKQKRTASGEFVSDR